MSMPALTGFLGVEAVDLTATQSIRSAFLIPQQKDQARVRSGRKTLGQRILKWSFRAVVSRGSRAGTKVIRQLSRCHGRDLRPPAYPSSGVARDRTSGVP